MRADLRSLPGHLDRIDGWLREGVLGGETVNAADLQIAPHLAADAHDRRRAAVLRRAARPRRTRWRLFGEWAGSTPPGVFPAEWLSARPA